MLLKKLKIAEVSLISLLNNTTEIDVPNIAKIIMYNKDKITVCYNI